MRRGALRLAARSLAVCVNFARRGSTHRLGGGGEVEAAGYLDLVSRSPLAGPAKSEKERERGKEREKEGERGKITGSRMYLAMPLL